MGYYKLTGNEEDLLEALSKLKVPLDDVTCKAYPHTVKALRRKKFISKNKITSRGKSAIEQWIKTGYIWLAPLSALKRIESW